MTKLSSRRQRIQCGRRFSVAMALLACHVAALIPFGLAESASVRQLLVSAFRDRSRRLRGLRKSHEKLPIKRRLQNMPKPSGSGGGGSGSGGGGGGGGGSGCEKKYLGCLGYTSSQLANAWIFPGSPPSCEYVHHRGYNAFYNSMYESGYFNGGYSSEGSNGGDSTWGGSTYSGGYGYFSGESQSDGSSGESAAGGSFSYWGGSSYSGGSSGYFSGNGESNGETSENADSPSEGSNAWGGSTYNGAGGYFNGAGSADGGSDQNGDAYGGYYSGASGQVSAGNQAGNSYDANGEYSHDNGAGNNYYQSNGKEGDYDYSQVRQYNAEQVDDDEEDVVLTNEDFENVNDEDLDGQSYNNQNEGNEQANGQNAANGENQDKNQNNQNNGQNGGGQQNANAQGNDDASVQSSYQDKYDPYTDFSLQNCDTYENLWLWDMSLTCESEDSLENCKCSFTEELMTLGLLSCDQISLCPSNCRICTTCLTLVGCSPPSESSTTSPSFASSPYLYVLGATTGVVIFALSYFIYSRSRKGGGGTDLGARLMSNPTESQKSGESSTSKDMEPPTTVWLAPEVPPAPAQNRPRKEGVAAAAAADEDSVDNSTLYSYPPEDAHAEQESVAIASVDDTFRQTPLTNEEEFGEDKVWLAPVN